MATDGGLSNGEKNVLTVTTQARKQCRKSQKTLHGWELSI
jgi:hypothetical protein